MKSILILLAGAALAFGQYGARAAALDRDLTAWQAQGTTVSDDQLLARVNTLSTSIPSFTPVTPGDYQTNRDLVRRSLSYLAQVESRAYANPALGRRVAGTYGTLGDYQNRPAFRSQKGYGQGAAFGYAGAGRISRRMYLGGYGSERDVERYAMQLAGLGSGYGYGYGYGMYPGMYNRQRAPQGLEAVDLGPIEDNGKKPLPLPSVDTSKLTAEQRAAWSDLSLEFVAVSSRVHQTQQSLDALEQRLRRQGMDVNSGDRATAYQMDGFLQDSAALAVAGDFAKAKQALDRASYLRNKLKSVVGD